MTSTSPTLNSTIDEKQLEVDKSAYASSTDNDGAENKPSVEEGRRDDIVTKVLSSTADKKEGKSGVLDEQEDESKYMSGTKLYLVMLALALACLLVGLDNSILATAIPTITTQFNSLHHVGWYGSGFFITVCALQPTAGKLFTYFSLKWTYLAFLFVFEVGSLLCGVAQNSETLIIGRAVAGLGAAGLFSGALVIVSNLVVLRMRPAWTGLLVGMFGISNVVGPLLGAAFTENVSWRWCFYINLPLGGVTAAVLVFFFKVEKRELEKLPVKEKLKHLDLPGLLLFIPAIIMILLALQWGGHSYAWNSATIIGLLVGFVLVLALFIAWQWRQQDEASIPPRIFLQRSVWSGVLVLFFGLGSATLAGYYFPMWFQVILNDTPIESGVRFLPTVIANFIMAIVSGGLVTQLGWYNPWLFFGAILLTIGLGVFSSFEVNESNAMIIGIQILVGAGTPELIQMPLIGLMALLPENDLPVATAIAVMFQFLGGAIFLGVAENIFVSTLRSALVEHAPQVDAHTVVAAGAVGIHRVVSDADLPSVILAYNDAITAVFYLGIAGGVLSFIFSFGMKWKSVKDKQVTSVA